jgi:hypothetical protein
MPQTFEARMEIPGRKAESKPAIPLHSSDEVCYCTGLIASKRDMSLVRAVYTFIYQHILPHPLEDDCAG